MTASELERELDALAHMIDCLAPTDARDPERWHAQKSALRARVRGLIEGCGLRSYPTSPRSFAAPAADSGVAAIVAGGRTIAVERRRSHPAGGDR